MGQKVMVAMSGGVDSSAAAVVLQHKGCELVGATLRLYDASEPSCGSIGDVVDARLVASRLGMHHHIFSMTHEFDSEVVSRFADSYVRGETPNPCIICNRRIKFGLLLDKAKELDCTHLATGHYARVDFDEGRGRWVLKKAMDASKDQTYVLYSLTQDALSRTLFPMGEFLKSQGRLFAMQKGLINAEKPDSQDICFIPDGDYAGFLRRRCGVESKPGDFVDEEGRVLGQHQGLIHYTIGQRKGLGLSLPSPLYVLRKEAQTNRVVLGPNERLYSDHLTAGELNWISIASLDEPIRVTAKTRYSQKEAAATVSPLSDGRANVVFDEPQRAITPGQAVVFYDGELVVGGGTILSDTPA